MQSLTHFIRASQHVPVLILVTLFSDLLETFKMVSVIYMTLFYSIFIILLIIMFSLLVIVVQLFFFFRYLKFKRQKETIVNYVCIPGFEPGPIISRRKLVSTCTTALWKRAFVEILWVLVRIQEHTTIFF